jgi:hypothetical protein
MDFESMTPEQAHQLVLHTIPSVLATAAARIVDPSGDVMSQVTTEQIELAMAAGIGATEFGLIKLMASERVIQWLLTVLSQVTKIPPLELLMDMQDTVRENGIENLFLGGEGA